MNTNERDWMYKRWLGGGIMNPDFERGVEMFLNFAFSRQELGSHWEILCPCNDCANRFCVGRDEAKQHIYYSGFMPAYYIWTSHGESSLSGTGYHDYGSSSSSAVDYDNLGFRQLVYDVAGPHLGAPDEEPNPDAQSFYNLLRQEDQELYPGCEHASPLSTTARLLNIKTSHNVAQTAFDQFVSVMKSVLPNDNKLPGSFYESKKLITKLGMGVEKIHVCPNECMLFYKETSELDHCAHCGAARFISSKGDGRRLKGVAAKVLRYFPIIPRLQRLFMSRKTVDHMSWHANNPGVPGVMTHPSHSEAWKHFDRCHSSFASDPRNVRLGLCTDGFNPFGYSAKSYSIWPVIITVYNLPPWMCMTRPFMFLSLLIPGRDGPGQNIDVYLRPLIDDLKLLWADGVSTWDASRRQNFQMRAALMWTINDFPAYGILSGWSTHGRLACPICMEDTKAFRLKHCGKPCWFDCHRRYLPPDHPFRRQRQQFTKNRVEKAGPPHILSGEEIRLRVEALPEVEYGPFMKSKDRLPGFGESHNWRRKCIFWELSYWSTLLVRHNLDAMHVEKNLFDNLFYMLMGVKGKKNKDDAKSRKDIVVHCNRPELELTYNGGRLMMPKSAYSVNKQDADAICRWIRHLKLPDGYASNISNCVDEENNVGGLKSHDCHVFLQRFMPVAFRDLIPTPLWNAMTELCHFFRDITSTSLVVEHCQQLERDIPLILCKLEKILPPSFFDSMEHLPIHLVFEARVCGPQHYRWMYPFERFIQYLQRKVSNKAYPEGSICEAYLVEEVSIFCSFYFEDDFSSPLHRPQQNPDGGARGRPGCLSIFSHPGRPMPPTDDWRTLDPEDLHVAHTYILLNCDEIGQYVELFDANVRQTHGYISDADLSKYRDSAFAPWLHSYVYADHGFQIDDRIRALSYGPSRNVRHFKGYFTNGYKFRINVFEPNRRTAHSGICVRGSVWYDNESDYYGVLLNVYELYYGEDSVVLFKCHWFDTTRGVRVVHPHGLVEVKHESTLASSDVFILASQAQQVYYMSYPSKHRERKQWWIACKVRPRREFVTNLVEEELQANEEVDSVYQDDQTRTIGNPPDNGPEIASQSLADPFIEEEVEIEELHVSQSHQYEETSSSNSSFVLGSDDE